MRDRVPGSRRNPASPWTASNAIAAHEGRFGRMLRKLSPATHLDEDQLAALVATMRDDDAPTGWNAGRQPHVTTLRSRPATRTLVVHRSRHHV